MLVNSQKCANEIVYFRSNPYRKQCELMCLQILLYYNFHVSLRSRQKSGMISFALESPGFESHTDILFLSLFSVIFYVVSIITARQRTLLMKILICDYIIYERPFSHMGQGCPILWLSEIFLSRPACPILG